MNERHLPIKYVMSPATSCLPRAACHELTACFCVCMAEWTLYRRLQQAQMAGAEQLTKLTAEQLTAEQLTAEKLMPKQFTHLLQQHDS